MSGVTVTPTRVILELEPACSRCRLWLGDTPSGKVGLLVLALGAGSPGAQEYLESLGLQEVGPPVQGSDFDAAVRLAVWEQSQKGGAK